MISKLLVVALNECCFLRSGVGGKMEMAGTMDEEVNVREFVDCAVKSIDSNDKFPSLVDDKVDAVVVVMMLVVNADDEVLLIAVVAVLIVVSFSTALATEVVVVGVALAPSCDPIIVSLMILRG